MKKICTRWGQLGVTLIEIILVLVIIAGAVTAAFVFSKRAKVQAAVQSEQRQFDGLVDSVRAVYSTKPNYAGISAATLKTQGLGPQIQYTTDSSGAVALVSRLANGRSTIAVDAASVKGANDGFDISVSQVSPDECTRLVPALMAKMYEVYVYPWASTDVRGPTPDPASLVASKGRLTDEAALSARCASKPNGLVMFRIWEPRNALAASASSITPSVCKPMKERQATACPIGQFGTIVQERDMTCTGANNSAVYSAWVTVDNTCAPMPPGVVVGSAAVPASQCGVITQTRADTCPSIPTPQVGQITNQRTLTTCTGTLTPWVVVSNSCQPAPPAGPSCTPGIQTQYVTCPAGQGGQVTQQRSNTCPSPYGPTAYGAWKTVGSTCSANCLSSGYCCRPQKQTQTTAGTCPAGSYGAPTNNQERYSSCPTATTPVASQPWGAWTTVGTGGTACTTCPANATETNTQWVPVTANGGVNNGCPAGQTGQYTWEKEQAQTRTKSYSCPAGTAVLPPPTYTAWSAWSDTGNIRNVVNTCTAVAACTAPAGALNGVWSLTAQMQLDPYAGAPGDVETNIGDLTRRNATANYFGGGVGAWTSPGWMGAGCYHSTTSGQVTTTPPSGTCIPSETIAVRRGPGAAPDLFGKSHVPGETDFFTCVTYSLPTDVGALGTCFIDKAGGPESVALTFNPDGTWSYSVGGASSKPGKVGRWISNGANASDFEVAISDTTDFSAATFTNLSTAQVFSWTQPGTGFSGPGSYKTVEGYAEVRQVSNHANVSTAMHFGQTVIGSGPNTSCP